MTTWLTGSPDISMNLHAYVMDFIEGEPNALMLFMAGYAEYAIRHKDPVEPDANLAGLKAVAGFYAAGKGLKKTMGLDNLAGLYKSGRAGCICNGEA